jgi:hypothetical protein
MRDRTAGIAIMTSQARTRPFLPAAGINCCQITAASETESCERICFS